MGDATEFTVSGAWYGTDNFVHSEDLHKLGKFIIRTGCYLKFLK